MNLVERTWQFLTTLAPVRLAALIFSIAFLVRLSIVVAFHPYKDLAHYELERIAISLATTGVYGNPYALPSGPSAHVAPGYTLLLAGLFRIFGTGIVANLIKELLASAVTSFQCAILPCVARGLGIDWRAGLIAALVSALYPAKPMVQIGGDWENPYTAIFIMLLSVLVVQLWRKRTATPRTAILHGISWGVALLFAPTLLPTFFILLAAGTTLWHHAGFRSYLLFAAIEMMIVAACLAPWAIRNEYALGSPIATRSNFGLEMRLSNNDRAAPTERANETTGVYRIYHPLQNPAEAIKVRQMGEVAYNKQALDQALTWIRSHPVHFVKLCLERIALFWYFVDPASWGKTLFLDFTAILGFAGLRFLFRSGNHVTGVVLALICAVYPLPYYLIHVSLRYKYPLDWIMMLLSAAFVVSRSEKLSRNVKSAQNKVPVSDATAP